MKYSILEFLDGPIFIRQHWQFTPANKVKT